MAPLRWAGLGGEHQHLLKLDNGSFCILRFLLAISVSYQNVISVKGLSSAVNTFVSCINCVSKLDTTNLSSFHFLNVNYPIHEKLLGSDYKTACGQCPLKLIELLWPQWILIQIHLADSQIVKIVWVIPHELLSWNKLILLYFGENRRQESRKENIIWIYCRRKKSEEEDYKNTCWQK